MMFDPMEVMDPDAGTDIWGELYKEGAENREHLDAATANYYLGRIKQNKAKMDTYKNQAKEMKDDFKVRVESWLQSRQDALDYDTQQCMAMLEAYWETNKPDNGKSISLPEGNIGMYAVQAKYDVDTQKDEIIKYLQDHKLTQFIRNKPELDKTELKKALSVVDGKLYLEGVELPNVPFTPKTKAFGVR